MTFQLVGGQLLFCSTWVSGAVMRHKKLI
jgi:hypothetical protein